MTDGCYNDSGEKNPVDVLKYHLVLGEESVVHIGRTCTSAIKELNKLDCASSLRAYAAKQSVFFNLAPISSVRGVCLITY